MSPASQVPKRWLHRLLSAGRIDILVNNAAILVKPTPFDQISKQTGTG
jgi:NAD(P)-dependent dehydrogenase (short-subunit alcohol dehydrogenase family)